MECWTPPVWPESSKSEGGSHSEDEQLSLVEVPGSGVRGYRGLGSSSSEEGLDGGGLAFHQPSRKDQIDQFQI